MTHVFIVNDQTFKYHLEYMFAGTGADSRFPVFLKDAPEDCHYSTERNLVGMIADISRLEVGDEVIFYLTGCTKFYGFFRVRERAFADIDGTYLRYELGKALTFRVLLEPVDGEVFAKGVTEHECLDSLEGISKPSEMCWSLIYRKLKGNRGCTAIFDYEAVRIKELIRKKNAGRSLPGSAFSFDGYEIITIDERHDYSGPRESIAIKERLLKKANADNAFEAHLQAHLMQEPERIKSLLSLPERCWLANEVSCGVGMQRIDIMAISERNNTVELTVIELKHASPHTDIIDYQLPWYVQWCADYVVPNFIGCEVVINLVIIARAFPKNTQLADFENTAKTHAIAARNATIAPTQFISFNFDAHDITFNREF